jgi:hypothetical protein
MFLNELKSMMMEMQKKIDMEEKRIKEAEGDM